MNLSFSFIIIYLGGFPGSSAGRVQLQCWRPRFDHWVGKIPRRRERLPTLAFWPGESHGLYSLWTLCSPWGLKDSDMTERLWLSFLSRLLEIRVYILYTLLPNPRMLCFLSVLFLFPQIIVLFHRVNEFWVRSWIIGLEIDWLKERKYIRTYAWPSLRLIFDCIELHGVGHDWSDLAAAAFIFIIVHEFFCTMYSTLYFSWTMHIFRRWVMN